MERINLRLTVDLEYTAEPEYVERLIRNLSQMVQESNDDFQFVWDTDAVLDSLDYKIEVTKK